MLLQKLNNLCSQPKKETNFKILKLHCAIIQFSYCSKLNLYSIEFAYIKTICLRFTITMVVGSLHFKVVKFDR